MLVNSGWKNVKTEREELITLSEESMELPDETGQEIEESMTVTPLTVTWVEPGKTGTQV